MPPKNETIESLDELIDFMISKRLMDTHTSLPAVIESFDASTQTAKVNVAIKRVRDIRNADGTYTEKTIQIAPILNVPVQFPGGGGFHITFPVSAGDECLLMFQERSIDNWQQEGGIQKPLDRRMHEYTDAVAIVGIHSNPNTISSFSENSLQIRNNDGSTYINVTDGVVELNGDSFAGLVKINELTTKLNTLQLEVNALITAYNAHGAGATNHPPPTVPAATPFVASDYENTTVVHG